MKKLKKSEFNYIQEKDDEALIYNTLYNSLVRLNEEEYRVFKGELAADKRLEREFVEHGLWVNADLDEKRRYLACSKAYTLFVPRPLDITITTTLKCNARCVYCYEKGVNQADVFVGAEERIIEFIKIHGDAKKVQLVWFGGEPLMNEKFIDTLSERLTNEGISYVSYIITNGSLLNENIIKNKFKLWNLKNMQITLDGTKKIYESRKNYRNSAEGEFYKIINSIKEAAQRDVFVHIRLNIDRYNRTDIIELLKEIDNIFSSYENVVFYPAFITGSKEPLSDEEKVAFIREMLLAVKNIKKLTASTKFYSYPRMHACMNGDPKSFSIDVDGNIFTCEHYVGISKKRIGTLKNGIAEEDIRGKKIRFREECNECVFLPKCYGGCASNFAEGDSPCMIEKYLIKAYLEII